MPGGPFVILPMQPTPNGRLHLGHASGPYLRADAVARHLRRSGHVVEVVCGSDVFENWILLDCERTGRTPVETVNLYHAGIRDDLAALAIDVDDFVNPLDPQHAEAYRAIHETLIDSLIASGSADLAAERFPVSSGSGRYVVGVWLLGRCPNCNDDVAGNSCENCGYHFQPSEVQSPRSRLDEGELEWRQEDCWFLKPRGGIDPIVRCIEETGADPAMVVPTARTASVTRGIATQDRWSIAWCRSRADCYGSRCCSRSYGTTLR
jgi:methionyl-tRNA synthetase